jgi:hypothetical protein
MSTINSKTMDALLDNIMTRAEVSLPRTGSNRWSIQEDNFLRENLGWLTDAEIADELGRSVNAVHIRWSRDLMLPSPSRNPDIFTAHQAAYMLGIDPHKIAHWVDAGLIAGRLMAGGRKIRLIRRVSLMVWVCNPKNWVYFDIHNVQDVHVKRLLKLKAKRWGDEWWSARQAADYHSTDAKEIVRQAKLGRIESYRLPVSLGGRHGDASRKWSNHYFLKSAVVKLEICHGKGCYRKNIKSTKFTARADAWLLKARDELGMTFVEIGRTMKIGHVSLCNGRARTNKTIGYRYKTLKIAKLANKSKKKGTR